MKALILTTAIVLAALALATSADPADARDPDPDGCYRSNWTWPFLDMPSIYCPPVGREANADGPNTPPTRERPPRDEPDYEPPKDHCPPKGYE